MNLLFYIPPIVWLITSGIFFALGEFFSKKFAISPSIAWIVYLVIVDILSLLAWLPAIMQKSQLSIIGTMWSVISLVLTVLIGVLIFGEKLNTLSIAGIIFALISIILLSIA
ncbi:MAG: hypothetical protein WCF92_01060 [bacterium]